MFNFEFVTLTVLSLCYVNVNGDFDLDSAQTLFSQYIQDYDKKYQSQEEYLKRFGCFKTNLKKINGFNKQNPTFGLTPFTDYSEEELAQRLLSCVMVNLTDSEMINFKVTVQADPEFDWRNKGVVTEVKDQLHCRSCWAFSVTGEVEGQNALRTGRLISLSEQELVDCAKSCSGCVGGYLDTAMNDIANLGGFMTEKSYKYEAMTLQCRYNVSEAVVKIKGGKQVNVSESGLDAVLTQHGPISAAVYANEAFNHYNGASIFDMPDCKGPLNHAVLVVGYTKDYWIIKNSWGTDWGDKGYIKLKRGVNMCEFGSFFVVSEF